eukprot:gene10560-12285_t
MRKRREKVEQWRKEKEKASAPVDTPVATTEDTNGEDTKWSLEDDDDVRAPVDTEMTPIDAKKDTAVFLSPPKPASATVETKKPEEKKVEEEEDDDVDPLDAFMNNLTNSANNADSAKSKKTQKSVLIEGEEGEELEAESDGENDKEKEVKKGKREMLSTDHSKVDYIEFEKSFYVEVPLLTNMTETEVLDLRSDLGIKITGNNCPKPVQSWAQCGLPEKIHILLKKYKYESPTPIQAQTIPAILQGRNVIGIARTGSGKTLAFLLPMFRHIMAQEKPKQGEGMVGLIMSPTRELAMQIYAECRKFSVALGLRVCCVYGGANIGEQIAELKRGADIVVCTPGRMIDILCANNRRITNLKRVSFVVLDEADRMFDLGFGPQIMCVIDNVRPDRQTVMFSATFPFKVEQVARKILTRPLEIIAGGRSIVCSDVEQIIEVRPEETRHRRLLELLSVWYHKGCILIFTNKQDATDNLFKQLTLAGYQCLSLHGKKDQTDRDETITDFKNKRRTILIATPLASRGLDVKDLNLVINFDCPDHLEDYVHRVGRTGRAGNKGTAYTFITPDEERFAPSIVKALEQSGAKVPDELTKLMADYAKKRAEGKDVKVAGSGFSGRGHKFDAAEEDKKKEERKLQRKAYGIDDDDEEAAPVEPIAPTEVLSETKSPISTPTLTSTTPAVDVSQQAFSQILGGAPTKAPEDAIRAAQIAFEKLKATKVAAASAGCTTNSAGHVTFHEELEINDYSQQARWKVTHKDALVQIIEMTSTAITTKGTYFPPSKSVPTGERKLYLLIEGPQEHSVRQAKAEIKRILDETQLNSQADKGKYSVFN